jgi:ATP-dependent Lon protease
MEIAKRYLIPKQIKENGITDKVIEFKDKEIERIISEFTMESGVRNLDVSKTFSLLTLIRELLDQSVDKLPINLQFLKLLSNS